jgi:NADPH:quinone reductase-like Zn-dependent oxidoreductase
MLFGKAAAVPGEHVLIQGAGGGVATAAIVLASHAGLEVTTTSRSSEKLERATELGAHHVLAHGERLTAKVDFVIDTVGAATWRHSLQSVKRGGRIVLAGGTSGFDPPASLSSLFMRDVAVLGTYMGSRRQLELLTNMLVRSGCRPVIDSQWSLIDVDKAAERMINGQTFGKVIIQPL